MSVRDQIINAIYSNQDAGMAADEAVRLLSEAILANVSPEARSEVEYALQLAGVTCPVCEGTGRATWLDDCEQCGKPD